VEDAVEDGVSGLVVSPRDVTALSRAIRRASSPEGMSLGRVAAERVRSLLSIERVVPAYERMYEDLVVAPADRRSMKRPAAGHRAC
jgi:glycosyltransferase involved in cell wall biosynthesis